MEISQQEQAVFGFYVWVLAEAQRAQRAQRVQALALALALALAQGQQQRHVCAEAHEVYDDLRVLNDDANWPLEFLKIQIGHLRFHFADGLVADIQHTVFSPDFVERDQRIAFSS